MKLKKNKSNFPSIYFGFLSGFSLMIIFLGAKALIKFIPIFSDIYSSTAIASIFFIFYLKFSYNYAKYDKDLRKSLLYSSIGLLIIYYLII